MRRTPSLPSLSGPLWSGVVAPDRVLSMGQIELNFVLMRNWIVWNWTVLTFKLRIYAKLNCLKCNCLCMLNWIVWNITVFYIETVLTLNWIVWNRTVFYIETLLTQNWIVWYWTVLTVSQQKLIKSNWISRIRTVWINWIAWNRNIFLQLNCILMLNWIVWNRTEYLH